MNILYVMQQSIYDNKGKWLTADSNIQMGRGIISELVRNTNWNFYIMIGKLEDFADILDYRDIIDHPRVHFVPWDFPVCAFTNRYNFDTRSFSNLLDKLPKIDILWNNITELTLNMKTVFHMKKAKDPYNGTGPLYVTACYWMDLPMIDKPKVPSDISYSWRQFDGYLASDIAAFSCETVRDAFFQNAYLQFETSFVDEIKEKSTIWDFGFESHEMEKYKVKYSFKKPTILFLNRLSGMNYTHHEEFIEALKLLKNDFGDGFNVIFTNPSKKFEAKWLLDNVPNCRLVMDGKPLDRQQYIQLLYTAHISVHLFDLEHYGGCASRESIHAGNVIVCPKIFEYERICGPDYPFYVSDITPRSIYSALKRAIKQHFEFTHTASFEAMCERNLQSSYEENGPKVFEDIKHMMKKLNMEF